MPSKVLEQCLQVQPLTKEEVIAIKALAEGKAEPGQQHLALAVIVKKLSRMYDLAYFPGKPDEGHFMAGRQFVGLKITNIINQKTPRE